MIVFLCALLDMHGNHHHHHHQRTDLGGIMSITSVFTIGPFVPCTPLWKILNTPVMSICLVKQNDGTWVEKQQRFLFIVYKRFLFLSRFFTFLTFFIFFLERFFTSLELMTVCITLNATARLHAATPSSSARSRERYQLSVDAWSITRLHYSCKMSYHSIKFTHNSIRCL